MIRNKAPFPYMGSKQRVALDVWQALGNVTRYIEPFFGSGAVLLNRPHRGKSEIVNDLDGYVCNFWRALKADPEGVAALIPGPVCELDIRARNALLTESRGTFTELLQSDPYFYDVEFAAWWAWGASASVVGWQRRTNPSPTPNAPGFAQYGILHHLRRPLKKYLSSLASRLDSVMVYCGDWSRCLTDAVAKPKRGATVGVFLDPPYSTANMADVGHYAATEGCVSKDVRNWCLERGNESHMRIVLCGMGDEHSELERHGWRVQSWIKRATFGGLSTSKSERIWYSPHCLRNDAPLFASMGL